MKYSIFCVYVQVTIQRGASPRSLSLELITTYPLGTRHAGLSWNWVLIGPP